MPQDRMNHPIETNDDRPVPSQLRRLAMCSLSAARKKDAIRVLHRDPCVYWSRLILRTENEALDPQALDAPLQRRRVMALQLARRAVDQGWSMRLVDTDYFDNGVPQARRRMQSVYNFDWQQDTVTHATRALVFVARPPQRPLEHGLENFAIPDDVASELAIEADIAHVTMGDCDQLIEEVAQYYSQLDQLERVRS